MTNQHDTLDSRKSCVFNVLALRKSMRSTTKIWLLISLVLVAISSITFLVKYTKKHKEKLIVGMRRSGLPPSTILKPENFFDGFDIEVARKIAKKLNRKLVIKTYTEDTEIQAVQSGEIDLTCDSMAITKRRLEDVDMIHLYGVSHSYLTGVMWKNIPENFKSIHDLKKILETENKFACVLKNSSWFFVLQDYGIKNIISVATENDLLSQIKSGKALIVFAGQFRADFFHRQDPDVKIFKMQLDEPWGFGAGMCIKKGRTELMSAVKKIVDELKADGTITQLQYKWFGRTFDKL